MACEFLEEGSYRIKIETGSNVIWRSVFIPSFKRSSGEKQSLTVLSAQLESFPLVLDYSVKDRLSGKDLSLEVVVQIKENDNWVLLTDSDKGSLRTGRMYELRFVLDGYEQVFYRLNIDYYQTVLNLDLLMAPVAAVLRIDPTDVRIRINGENKYFSADTYRYEKLINDKNNGQLLKLFPGEYLLSSELNDMRIENKIVLVSGHEIRVFPAELKENGIKMEIK